MDRRMIGSPEEHGSTVWAAQSPTESDKSKITMPKSRHCIRIGLGLSAGSLQMRAERSAGETVRALSAGKEADRKAFDPNVGAEERPGQCILAGVDVFLRGGDKQLVEVLAAEGAGGHLARGHRKLFL
jgi:hypothetical protein